MTEILIAVVSLIVGTVVAWLWRGLLARAALAPVEQRLSDAFKALSFDALKTMVVGADRKLTSF